MKSVDTFTFRFPDGDEVIALVCAGEFMLFKRTEKCSARKRGPHVFKALMDITQWGFDCFKWVNVYKCQHCGETWAVRGETNYEGEVVPA